MVSYDIVSLYTNIPTVEAIDFILRKLFPNEDSTFNGFTKEIFKNLLELVLLNNYFLFNDLIYQQIDGLGMGSPLAQIIANIFLLYLEEKFLKECPKEFAPTKYYRYVDDTFVTFTKLEYATEFLNYINNVHPSIKFTMETEHEASLNFLDLTIKRTDSGFETSVYRKKTFTGLGLNFFSACPLQYKLGSCKSLLFRAYNLCSNLNLFHQEIEYLKNYFTNNNFNAFTFDMLVKNFLNNIFHKPQPIPSVPKLQIYCSFPYLGEINTSFKKELQSLLDLHFPLAKFFIASKNPLRISSFFHMKNKIPTLLKSNVIYQYTCSSCKLESYIGSTSRLFKVRICEHMGISHRTLTNLKCPSFSAIRAHAQICHSPISFDDFKIIDTAANNQQLQIKESIYIK